MGEVVTLGTPANAPEEPKDLTLVCPTCSSYTFRLQKLGDDEPVVICSVCDQQLTDRPSSVDTSVLSELDEPRHLRSQHYHDTADLALASMLRRTTADSTAMVLGVDFNGDIRMWVNADPFKEDDAAEYDAWLKNTVEEAFGYVRDCIAGIDSTPPDDITDS